jgi:hypothetical protein
MSQLRKHKTLIYNLKRTFGTAVDFYELLTNDHNLLTGAITRDYKKTTIRRAIVLPATLDRSFVYDLAYIASSKNFTGGGFFDRTKRHIIIDAKDLPKDLKPKIKMHLEFEDERFEIVSIEVVAARAIYLISVQSLSNAKTVG